MGKPARSKLRRHDDLLAGFGPTWEYVPAQCASIAAEVQAGDLVYNPSIEPEPDPPDLAALRVALAARGLRLEDQGAFYWLVAPARPSR